jgi:hypothetical protein
MYLLNENTILIFAITMFNVFTITETVKLN